MLGTLYAVITVLAWGTWLAPSQNIPFKNQQIKTFYVASASLVLAFFVTLPQGFDQITPEVFWPPFVGGLIWAVSGYCAFTATHKLGMARASGIWSPLNIVVSLFWGATIFNEFLNTGTGGLIVLIASVTVIIIGVLLIIFAKGRGDMISNRRDLTIGALGAIGAGILWGSYFIPIKQSDVSLWIATFPLTIGIFVGSTALMLLGRQSPRLEKRSDYARASASGVLWGIGNYAMLLLINEIGAGRGFTIAQLAVVVNALIGVYLLKDPRPRTRAATLTLIGCVLAMIGGVVLGNLK
jgi:glucose uptake protein